MPRASCASAVARRSGRRPRRGLRRLRVGRRGRTLDGARRRRGRALAAGRPVRDPLQHLGAHRARRREQEALAEAHVVVEQVDHGALALDPLGDQVDAEAAEQVGEIRRMDVALRRRGAVEQQRGRHLDEAEAALGELARLHAQVGHVVHREAEAEIGERGDAGLLDRPHLAHRALGELEHQIGREHAVRLEEVGDLP